MSGELLGFDPFLASIPGLEDIEEVAEALPPSPALIRCPRCELWAIDTPEDAWCPNGQGGFASKPEEATT